MEFVNTIHLLAHVQKEQRDIALHKVRLHLKEHGHELSFLDISKLWEGLFYCYWLTDKEYVQHQVARYMARLIHAIPRTGKERSVFMFIASFYQTIIRYWKNIDVHRTAKFMSLMRYFLHESMVFLRDTCAYAEEHLKKFNRVLLAGPLTVHNGNHVASLSVLTHFVDIYIEEAEKVFSRNETSKIYDMDVDIDYDGADAAQIAADKKQQQEKRQNSDVQEVTADQLMLLLEPFFTVYATAGVHSILVAFDKGIWRLLQDYKDLNFDLVNSVKKEKYLDKRGIYITAGLLRTQEYARPAKGSLNVDLQRIANSFKEKAYLDKTKNKTQCVEWHNAFTNAYEERLMQENPEDPLAGFQQELVQVKVDQKKSKEKQEEKKQQQEFATKKRKLNSGAAQVDEEDDDEEDSDFEVEIDSDDDDDDDALMLVDDEDDGEDDDSDDDDEEEVDITGDDDDEDEAAEEPGPATEQLLAMLSKKRKFGASNPQISDSSAKLFLKKLKQYNRASMTTKQVIQPAPVIVKNKKGTKVDEIVDVEIALPEKKQQLSKKQQKQQKQSNGNGAQQEGDTDGKQQKRRVSFGLHNNEFKLYGTQTAPDSLSKPKEAKNAPLKPLSAKSNKNKKARSPKK